MLWSNCGKTLRACGPSCAGIFRFDFEEQDLDEAAVRRLVWREMSYYQQQQ